MINHLTMVEFSGTTGLDLSTILGKVTDLHQQAESLS